MAYDLVNARALKSVTIAPDASIRSAARIIQDADIKILLVCDENLVLLGTVTDGDIRRAVSNVQDLDGGVDTIMNRTPKVATAHESVEVLRPRMRASVIRHMPRVDDAGRVVGLVLFDAYAEARPRESAVVLMAGGRGSRLMPLTATTPKPLLDVGGKPVMERQIEQLIGLGFRRFYISVNYLAHMIEAHFGDGSQFNVKIDYLREDQPLGTAGALCLLEMQQHPLIVMNGDIITKADCGTMLDFCVNGNFDATMGVREHHYTVPFGCVSLNGDMVLSVEEKPTFRHLVNAGIYVLTPSMLDLIPRGEFFDMPQLFQKLIAKGRRATSFLITEEWIDIGRKDDLLWAQQIFGSST